MRTPATACQRPGGMARLDWSRALPSIPPPPADSGQQARRRPVRVLVTGSRKWTDSSAVYDALDALAEHGLVTVVHGACPGGADNWARAWVQMRGQTEEPHPADWRGQHRKRAGFIRNTEMARAGADLCLAFIHNMSNGATHCAREAVSNGILTIVFRQTYPDLSQVADALALSSSLPLPASEVE